MGQPTEVGLSSLHRDLFYTCCDLSSFSSKEHKYMRHVSFHDLSQVRKLFPSVRVGLHLFLFLPGVTAYLFREALSCEFINGK